MATTTSDQASGTPRYLPQNDVDESLHTLLDLIDPWITQANIVWESVAPTNHVHCPPRALYIYDDFARGVAAATAAFESVEVERGGEMLRQAFIDLEHIMAPKARSVFTLHSLFFALATLSQAKLYKASRLLVAHATSLVDLRAQLTSEKRDGVHCQVELCPRQTPKDFAISGHLSHPFPQMLKRLQLLAARLEGDDTTMTKIFFLAWSVYHRATSAASVRTIYPQVSRKEYWNSIVWAHRDLAPSYSRTTKWIDTMKPVLYYLDTLRGYAESKIGVDDDLSLLALGELVSVYGFGRHEKFEETAIELLGRMDKKIGKPTRENAVVLEQWSLADLELASYYKDKGDLEGVVKHFSRIVPDTAGTKWEAMLRDELQGWIRQTHYN
jgi:hypothetical protein